MLEESRRQALVAIDFYNRVGDKRSLHDFIVHMHMAWLHLLHAEFEQAGTSFVYKDARGRTVKIDGEPKTWDLHRSLAERYADNDPVRRNVEFFAGLRNKVEHRVQREVDAVTGGMAHAFVINYETERIARFGRGFSMADELRFPIFLHSLTPSETGEIRKATRRLPAATRNYITRYRAALDPEVRDSERFDYRVLLTPLKGPKSEADLAVTFIRNEDLTEEKVRALRAEGKVGTVITVEKQRPVMHKDEMAPAQVVELVDAQLPFTFNMSHHTRLARKFALRPFDKARDQAITDLRYCLWDKPWKKYVYTQAWMRKIVEEIGTVEKFTATFGKPPHMKVTTLTDHSVTKATPAKPG